jgi:nickel/cobalt exporter
MLEFLVQLQSAIRTALTGNIDSFAVSRDWWVLYAMVPVGILFGAAHALTPGHGKSVLASYAVGSDLSRIRIIWTALALTLTHIGTAVLLAFVGSALITRTIVGAGQVPALEMASRLLLVVVGLWLIVRAALGRSHVHGEGIAAGVIAGLIPCPLTLFLMFFASARGVPEAGFTFALAMLIGVGIVLTAVAVSSVMAREALLVLFAKHGVALGTVARGVDAAAGCCILLLAVGSLVG